MTPDSIPHSATASDLPEVYCVIPHYGDDALLQRCLDSLGQIDYPTDLFNPDHIVVTNNNPPNTNLLFTAGVNAGIHKVRQLRLEKRPAARCLIWVLNNDTRVEPDCVHAAARCFMEMAWDKTGAVGSRNLLMERPDVIAWGGSKECFPAGNHKTGSVAKGDLALRTEEEWLTFASVFLNQDAIEAIGLLDRNLRHICSDSDYCFRLRAQGWHCYYEPTSVVLHAVGTSNRNASPELIGIMRKDAEYFMSKWVRPGLFNSLTKYQLS